MGSEILGVQENGAQRPRAVLCLSGGMDSSVCAALAVRDFGAENTAALHIDYGQRTERREGSRHAATNRSILGPDPVP